MSAAARKAQAPGRWVEDPAEALAAFARHDGLRIVDFDETLYLRNSTEDFIAAARPRALGRRAMRLVERAAPWRALGGEATRDVWRSAAVAAACPWIWGAWRERARALATAHVNRPLLAAMTARPEGVIVASAGFAPVIRPMLAAMGLARVPLVASRFGSLRDRRVGKLALLARSAYAAELRGALVVTDSLDDAALLEGCAAPCRVLWPGARFVPAFSEG